eukprot:scaffold8776_cov124-Isochrysis_galbana.AAC.2
MSMPKLPLVAASCSPTEMRWWAHTGRTRAELVGRVEVGHLIGLHDLPDAKQEDSACARRARLRSIQAPCLVCSHGVMLVNA